MLAAGHPRLNFEFTSYLNALLPHWSEQKQKRKRAPSFQAEAWATGQFVSARAAVKLLDWQAQRARENSHAFWPDFAGYDCFSCHHELRAKSWQQADKVRRLGTLAWGSWYFPLARLGDTGVDELRKNMRKMSPNPEEVAGLTRQVMPIMEKQLEQFQKGKATLATQPLMDWLRKNQSQVAAEGWDGTAQVYLAWKALQQPDDPVHRKAGLQLLSKTLAFPAEYSSPRFFRSEGKWETDLKEALRELAR